MTRWSWQTQICICFETFHFCTVLSATILVWPEILDPCQISLMDDQTSGFYRNDPDLNDMIATWSTVCHYYKYMSNQSQETSSNVRSHMINPISLQSSSALPCQFVYAHVKSWPLIDLPSPCQKLWNKPLLTFTNCVTGPLACLL